MRILFLSQVLPWPLDAGAKVRSHFVLRYLARRHRVTLLTFSRPGDRPEDVAYLAEFCESLHLVPIERTWWREVLVLMRAVGTGEPWLVARDRRRSMLTLVDRLVDATPFDAVHADQLWMAPYALRAVAAMRRSDRPAAATSTPPYAVLDQHNAVQVVAHRLALTETCPVKRALWRREARTLATYERRICALFDRLVWVTDEDRRAVAALMRPTGRQVPSTVIPIGVDPSTVKRRVTRAPPGRLVFIGGLRWPPNAHGAIWFARHIFPTVRARCPDVTWTVIGRAPPKCLAGEGIDVAGHVPDLEPYLAEAAVAIVPLLAGAGMRVKILDAWRHGLPVVSTTVGAEGIEVTPGENILIADDAPAFAEAVVEVLRQPELAARLSEQGRRTVSRLYDWRTLYAKWNQAYPP